MSEQLVVFGIPNCDQVRKTRTWLDERQLDYTFHDYKRQGVSRELLIRWITDLGLDAVLNRRGTTWRGLSDTDRQCADSLPSRAVDLMLAYPSLIKRPVLMRGTAVLVGYSPERFDAWLSA